jgi:lambda repressor-like predicted transcriptional regulator
MLFVINEGMFKMLCVVADGLGVDVEIIWQLLLLMLFEN